MTDRLIPGDFAPRIGDLCADHRFGDPIGVGRITERKSALDARVALV